MLKLDIQRFGGRGASSTPTQRKGMGMANRAGIPVYNGAIDYTGDFNGANLKSMTNKQLNTAIKVQTEQYNKYNNARNSFDGRTRNGRMERTFNSARASQYKAGLDNLNAEKTRREYNREFRDGYLPF
jgi:hypothetical protein